MPKGVTKSDESYMRAAVDEARCGLGHTAPNPAVGCIIVRGGRVVGRGHHARAGLPHAEVLALRAAGRLARGSTVYTTLEPCCHQGRTPACTNALLEARPARVVIGCLDPNPAVSGGGVRALRGAKIRTDIGVLEEESRDLIRGFARWVLDAKPWVHLKLAASLDGRIAVRGGLSKWISAPESRRLVQTMRARADAVLVGSQTVLQDDPRLSCRLRGASQPLRIILDRRLRTPPTARVLKGKPGCLIVSGAGAPARAKKALEAAGAEVLELPRPKTAAWQGILRELGRRGMHEVLIEGGAKVAASALAAGVVNGLTFFYNPRLIGGDGVPMIAPLAVCHPGDALRVRTRSWSRSGPDFVWHGVIA